MDTKIIGAGTVALSTIALHSLLLQKPFMKPAIGVFIATFLLAGMSIAGAAQVAGNLALLLAGTVVVLYGAPIIGVLQKL